MKNLIVAQSGGPTGAINASLAGVIDAALKCEEIDRIYGARYGIQGVLNRDSVDLSEQVNTEEKISLLKVTPAMALGSCRMKLPELTQTDVYDQILSVFHQYHVGYFIYIGGNDSMDTALKLSRYLSEKGEDIRVIGVPKTIDNDLAMTDHCPGFGSAAKFVATVVSEIVRDASVYNTPSVNIVEIMGRNAGWLTASAALVKCETGCAPQLIYLPEVVFDPERFLEDIRQIQKKDKIVIAAVSEGVKIADGRYVSELAGDCNVDTFGHKYTSGAGKYLENLVSEKIGCKVRSIELNVLQRCSGHILSADDIDSAFAIGQAAVRAAVRGESGKMMTFLRADSDDYAYTVDMCDLELVANVERKFPTEWMNDAHNGVTEQAIRYLRPLIQGEVSVPKQNGLPAHMVL